MVAAAAGVPAGRVLIATARLGCTTLGDAVVADAGITAGADTIELAAAQVGHARLQWPPSGSATGAAGVAAALLGFRIAVLVLLVHLMLLVPPLRPERQSSARGLARVPSTAASGGPQSLTLAHATLGIHWKFFNFRTSEALTE